MPSSPLKQRREICEEGRTATRPAAAPSPHSWRRCRFCLNRLQICRCRSFWPHHCHRRMSLPPLKPTAATVTGVLIAVGARRSHCSFVPPLILDFTAAVVVAAVRNCG
ncbi:uncharacterized protein [Arachis hypogaea]|uniref:uncharacterized protein isoform X1 n=1 Tax=Arachis hypogaea TaxID=3818 RepID=UPI003B2248DA